MTKMKLYILQIWSNVKLKAHILQRGKASSMVQFHGAEVGPFGLITQDLAPRGRHLRLVGGTTVPEARPADYKAAFPGLKEALTRLTDPEGIPVSAHEHSEALSKAWTSAVGQLVADGRGTEALNVQDGKVGGYEIPFAQ